MTNRKPPPRTKKPPTAEWKDRKLKRDPVRDGAHTLIRAIEEAIAVGAVRLPYPGLLEAIVDLKRALK